MKSSKKAVKNVSKVVESSVSKTKISREDKISALNKKKTFDLRLNTAEFLK
ncbi:MAG: hypothetical protein ACOZBL_00020 [Patescibacteria group bacterium]